MKNLKKTLILLLFLFMLVANKPKNDDGISPCNEIDFDITLYSLN